MMYTLQITPRPLPEGDTHSPQVINLTLDPGYDLAWTEFRPKDHPDNHSQKPELLIGLYPDPAQEATIEARVSLPQGVLPDLEAQIELHEGPFRPDPPQPGETPATVPLFRAPVPFKGLRARAAYVITRSNLRQ